MKFKIFLITAAVQIVVSNNLNSLKIDLINNYEDIMSSKRIILNFKFEPQDKVVYKDWLRFAINSPNINCKKWNGSIKSIREFSEPFKSCKQAYTKTFYTTIDIDFIKNPKKFDICTSCLLLKSNNKNRFQTFVLSVSEKS
jgi:hypothetical protein